jgi:hypothetical protein
LFGQGLINVNGSCQPIKIRSEARARRMCAVAIRRLLISDKPGTSL